MPGIWRAFPQVSSLPYGYDVGSAIVPPLKLGAISSYTRIEGVGTLTGTALKVKLATSALSGSGSLTANLSMFLPATASLSGSGSLSAALRAVSKLESALVGSGSLSANLKSLVPVNASLSGSASLSVSLKGYGRLEASILPYTDLSPEALAFSLLDDNDIETGYSLREALRLVLAACAGKVSGAAGTTITIRSVTDGTDRLVATVDSNGNRTAVTYDVADE